MILSAHQPHYLPYLGFLHKITPCDQFVLLDNVQFEKNGWQNRNKIRTNEGWMWLTVPVLMKGKLGQQINEVVINNEVNWQTKHWKSVYHNYKNAPYFKEHEAFLKEMYTRSWEFLVDLNEFNLRYFTDELEITVPIARGSEFNFERKKNDLLLEICERLGADSYGSGSGGGLEYMDLEKFKANRVNHLSQEFNQPTYPQQFEPFVPYLSALDLLLNCGHPRVNDLLNLGLSWAC